MSEKPRISFGKLFWPSFLASFIMSLIGLLIFALILGGIIGSFGEFGPKPLAIKTNSVLHLRLNGDIQEKGDVSINASNFSLDRSIGLSDVLFGIQHAKKDSKIRGIFIDIGDLSCGVSDLREIRQALDSFKKTGKFVVVYYSGELITQKEYYLGSIAGKSYAFPGSAMEFTGLGAELMFFKNTLDKLDIKVQIIRGKDNDFKSAVEPYFRENMSDSSRLQVQTYLSSIWTTIQEDISASRKIPIDSLTLFTDQLRIRRAQDAYENKLIDGLKYRDEVMAILASILDQDDKTEEDINFISFEKYARKKFYHNQALAKNDQPNVAVILAEGEISTTGDDGLTSEAICKLFRDVRKNKTIKTVVFRINSPGGSALASEEIWREVMLTNKDKKVIVSMGNVAASGGYYIATGGTRIFAEPTTITGSIGVFGMIPFAGDFFRNKMGITFDYVATNNHSVMSINKPLSAEEYSYIQTEVDEIYGLFLERVAKNRKMTVEQVNTIARGRVWTGVDAKRIGLVDELGTLNDAIKYAAKKASISDIRTLYYPLKEEDKWTAILEDFEEESKKAKIQQMEVPKEFKEALKIIQQLEKRSGIQMRLPYDITIR